MRINAGADCGAAQPEFTDQFGTGMDRVFRSPNRPRIGSELLAQAHRYCILHMSAAGLQDVVEFLSFFFKRRDERVKNWIEITKFKQGRQPHSGGENVIR